MPQRQEAQIVQSQLDLDDVVPWFTPPVLRLPNGSRSLLRLRLRVRLRGTRCGSRQLVPVTVVA